VPNGKIFTHTFANYGRGFKYIWNEIPVLITFESDWKKSKIILEKIAQEHAAHLSKYAERKVKETSRHFLIQNVDFTPAVYTTVVESGVELTIRYLCDPRKRRASLQAIWESILMEFSKHNDIDFAYPTERRFNNLSEGKGTE